MQKTAPQTRKSAAERILPAHFTSEVQPRAAIRCIAFLLITPNIRSNENDDYFCSSKNQSPIKHPLQRHVIPRLSNQASYPQANRKSVTLMESNHGASKLGASSEFQTSSHFFASSSEIRSPPELGDARKYVVSLSPYDVS